MADRFNRRVVTELDAVTHACIGETARELVNVAGRIHGRGETRVKTALQRRLDRRDFLRRDRM